MKIIFNFNSLATLNLMICLMTPIVTAFENPSEMKLSTGTCLSAKQTILFSRSFTFSVSLIAITFTMTMWLGFSFRHLRHVLISDNFCLLVHLRAEIDSGWKMFFGLCFICSVCLHCTSVVVLSRGDGSEHIFLDIRIYLVVSLVERFELRYLAFAAVSRRLFFGLKFSTKLFLT